MPGPYHSRFASVPGDAVPEVAVSSHRRSIATQVATIASIVFLVGITAFSFLSAGEIGLQSQRSDEIGKVGDVVEGIADQANLFALNAAIEAARAAGRSAEAVARLDGMSNAPAALTAGLRVAGQPTGTHRTLASGRRARRPVSRDAGPPAPRTARSAPIRPPSMSADASIGRFVPLVSEDGCRDASARTRAKGTLKR